LKFASSEREVDLVEGLALPPQLLHALDEARILAESGSRHVVEMPRFGQKTEKETILCKFKFKSSNSSFSEIQFKLKFRSSNSKNEKIIYSACANSSSGIQVCFRKRKQSYGQVLFAQPTHYSMPTGRGVQSMMPNILSVAEHIADALGHGVDDEAGEWCDHRWSQVLHPDATDWRSELLERIKSRSDWPGDGTREREGLESKLDEQLSMEGLNFLRGRAQQLMKMYWDDPDKLSFMCVDFLSPMIAALECRPVAAPF
jgi:hypothetical protein